jgi:hypothetical protein
MYILFLLLLYHVERGEARDVDPGKNIRGNGHLVEYETEMVRSSIKWFAAPWLLVTDDSIVL